MSNPKRGDVALGTLGIGAGPYYASKHRVDLAMNSQSTEWTVELPHLPVGESFHAAGKRWWPVGEKVALDGTPGTDALKLHLTAVDEATGEILGTFPLELPLTDPRYPEDFYAQAAEDVGFFTHWGDDSILGNYPDWVVARVLDGGHFERHLLWREESTNANSETVLVPKSARTPHLAAYTIRQAGPTRRWLKQPEFPASYRLWTPVLIMGDNLIASWEEFRHVIVTNIFKLGAKTSGFIFYETNVTPPSGIDLYTPDLWPPSYPVAGTPSAWKIRDPATGIYDNGAGEFPYAIEADIDEMFDWFATYWDSRPEWSGSGDVEWWGNRTSDRVPGSQIHGLSVLGISDGAVRAEKRWALNPNIGPTIHPTGPLRARVCKSSLVPAGADPRDHEVIDPLTDESIYVPALEAAQQSLLRVEFSVIVIIPEEQELVPPEWWTSGNEYLFVYARSSTSLHESYVPEFTRHRDGVEGSFALEPARVFYTVQLYTDSYASVDRDTSWMVPHDVTAGVASEDRFRLLPRPYAEWEEWQNNG